MAYRNTLSGAWSSFFAHMQQLIGTVGSGSTLAIRAVEEGESVLDAYPVPYLLVQFIASKVESRANNDKMWGGKIKFRIVSQVTNANGATTEILSKIAQVENKIEAYTKPDGVAGLENSEWSLTFETAPTRGNLIVADALRDFTVMVSRGSN